MTMRLQQLRWPAAELPAALASCDAVVYTASLASAGQDIPAALEVLGAAERSRFGAYTNDVVARRYAAGRRALREMLAAVLGLSPREVPLREGIHGKPYLAAATPGSVWFSVSHCDDLLVVALSRTADVGVDVERVRAFEHWSRVADRVLDPQERTQLDRAVACGEDASDVFLRHWCRVEAELKAVGCGIQGLDAHKAGMRPRGLRLADIGSLALPPDVAAGGGRYQAAVALCVPGSTYETTIESLRHTASAARHAAQPATSPASASTP